MLYWRMRASFSGASSKKKIHATQETKITANNQASFSPPVTLLENKIQRIGIKYKIPIKIIPIPAKINSIIHLKLKVTALSINAF